MDQEFPFKPRAEKAAPTSNDTRSHNDNNSAEIITRLTKELDHATAEYLQMHRTEIGIIREAPSGLPLSDGQYRIMQAGKRLKSAFEDYRKAVKRYRDFVQFGIVPEDSADCDPE